MAHDPRDEVHTTVTIPGAGHGRTITPYWRMLTTAGRAGEGLRAEWQRQLRRIQREMPFDYIRFHGLFFEDMHVYTQDSEGRPRYNFLYLDMLFDFLLSHGLRPFLELSFTPKAMASGSETCFHWRANITPPKEWRLWADLIETVTRHWIDRYGLEEVRRWYFEVWNEPNLGGIFWTGGMDGYFTLYETTARTLKRIDQQLRVGGPATSNFTEEGEAPWFHEFVGYCERNEVPVDFVSCHPYPNSWAIDTGGDHLTLYHGPDSTVRDLRWLRKFVDNSPFPDAEIHLTEWNSSPSPRDLVHDTAFMAPFLIDNNVRGIGTVDSLGYWTFTDIFEEQGMGSTPFHGGFGMMTIHGVKKPAYHAYWFLSRLGSELLYYEPGVLVTRGAGSNGDSRERGGQRARKVSAARAASCRLQVLLWNYCHYTEAFAAGDASKLTSTDRYGAFEGGETQRVRLEAAGPTGWYRIYTTRFDRQHGSSFDAWVAMGAPTYPDQDQIALLHRAAELDASVTYSDDLAGHLAANPVAVPPHGVTLLEIEYLHD